MTVMRIARYLVQNLFTTQDVEVIANLFRWYASHDLARILSDPSGLVGVVCYRPVASVPEINDFYTMDPHGRILWITCMAGTSQAAMRCLWSFFPERYSDSQFDFVAFRRRKNQTGKVSMIPFSKFNRHMNYGR